MNLLTAVILIIAAAVGGYVLGMVDARVTAKLTKKPETPPPAPVVTDRRPGEKTILRLSQDAQERLHLDLDEERADDPAALTPAQRQRMVNLLVLIRPWLEGKPAAQPPVVPQAQPVSAAPVPRVRTPMASETPAMTENAPRIDPIRGLRTMLGNEIKTPGKPRGMSIVTMIDDVLQKKLLSSPLQNKVIHLEDGPNGEVMVVVGASTYAGVDQVPDEEIRALIKSAISEWEQK